MEIEKLYGEEPIKRIYIATIVLKNFMGHANVEAHVFRPGATDKELDELRALKLVGKPDPAMPPELLEGATEEAALRCILEAFTREEAEQLAAYLEERYADQVSKLTICPLPLPVPLGVGPLSGIPQGKKSGFINFDLAPHYNLPFVAKAYYDLGE